MVVDSPAHGHLRRPISEREVNYLRALSCELLTLCVEGEWPAPRSKAPYTVETVAPSRARRQRFLSSGEAARERNLALYVSCLLGIHKVPPILLCPHGNTRSGIHL